MAAAAPSYYQGAPPSRGGKGGAPLPQGYPMAPHWGHPMVPPFPPHPHHMPPPPHAAAPAHAGAHHAPHHQPQHQRGGARAPPQQPQPQQARGPYPQQPQHPRLAKTSRHKLNSTYERVISQPPPLPAFKANPPPLPLRADRAPTRNVVCVLPDGNRQTLLLDEQDTYNDVRALVEQQTPFCGQELCVYVGDAEVRDENLTLAQMGLAEDAVIVLKIDQSRSGWGVAALPDERPGQKEENEEYKNLDHGDAKVLQGYTDKPASSKGRALMDIYEEVMSRPPPGTSNDPRADVPCTFYTSGKWCKFGERCAYSHAGSKGKGGVFFQRPDPRSEVDCQFFKNGRCLRNQVCPFRHGEAPQSKAALAQAAMLKKTNPDLQF
eukprot:Rhum_TRINITY_DN14312_c14_g1::Rhum_TRINITY_DN14312_c14_g1_i1::g.79367::m.79367